MTKLEKLTRSLRELGQFLMPQNAELVREAADALERLEYERDAAIDDAAVANNMLKLVYDHLKSYPGIAGGKE